MYNPKDVFTKQGLREHEMHVFNLQNALFHLRNNADDLHLFEDEIMNAIAVLEEACDGLLINGDGEENEYAEARNTIQRDRSGSSPVVS